MDRIGAEALRQQGAATSGYWRYLEEPQHRWRGCTGAEVIHFFFHGP